jgi:hypothetical protein
MKKLSSLTILFFISIILSASGSGTHTVTSLTMVEISSRYCIAGTWSEWETKSCKVVVDIYDDVPMIVIHNKLDQSIILNELKTVNKGLFVKKDKFLVSKIYVGKDNADELLTVVIIKYNDGNYKISFFYDDIMYSYSEAGFQNELHPKNLYTENSTHFQNKTK